jgi:hypothetical protein
MAAIGLTAEDAPAALDALAGLGQADAVVLGRALLLYDHIGAALRALLARCLEDRAVTADEESLLFWGVHVMAAARDAAAFPDMLRLLALPEERLDALLGDATTQTGARLIAGTFNDDHDALMAFIEQSALDAHMRWLALEALAFLTFDGRIARSETEDFLRRLYERRLFDEAGLVGYGWSAACALLGLDSMEPLVKAAFEAGLIDESICDFEGWQGILADAHARPADAGRFRDENCGYLDDLYESMMWVHGPDMDAGEEDDPEAWLPPPEPVRNPLRHVGRNDPCPCGSGKKYKKCCLS